MEIILDRYLLHIFILNFALVVVDAILGYHITPLIARQAKNKAQHASQPAVSIRRFLSVVVALYMFLDCLAYHQQAPIFLLVVTVIVLLDIVCQLLIRWKFTRETG